VRRKIEFKRVPCSLTLAYAIMPIATKGSCHAMIVECMRWRNVGVSMSAVKTTIKKIKPESTRAAMLNVLKFFIV
jgi:hypothetical protein